MIICDFSNKNENFGKKGEVLRKLHQALYYESNVYIPDTLVLPLSFFNNSIRKKLLSGEQDTLTLEQKKEIISKIRKKFNNKKIVVRSSASCEDSILFTNSGQYDSFLNLTTDDEILLAINKIFLSFVSSNATQYYEINNISLDNHGMAVLVQEVAPVKKAGVMFTVNPITGENNPIIELCNGLGEDVVSGQKKVETIKDNYENISDILKKIITIGKKIESLMGTPQDIEWGIDDKDNIYIFQARPIVINKRNITKLYEVNEPKNKIVGIPISMGFTIGKINGIESCNSHEIVLQTGKFTSKDLSLIINNKAVLLKTGGYLSHFANIIREFNKPAIIIDKEQKLDLNEDYVIDGYNGYIYKLKDLTVLEKNKAYWDYFVDLVCNGNTSYLKLIGIESYKFYKRKRRNYSKSINYILEENRLFISFNFEILEIKFISLKSLKKAVKELKVGVNDERIYRCR